MAIKFLQDIDVDGEVQGTSLDINGDADISGNLFLDDNSGASPYIQFTNGDNNYFKMLNSSSGKLEIYQANTKRADFSSGGLELVNSLTATGLDINGNADIAGTLSLDDTLTVNHATATSQLFLTGTGNGYVNAAVILQCNDDNGHSRGAGVYMNNVVGETEWFAGRPYSDGDSYQILRRHTTSGNHSNSTATAATSNTVAVMDIDSAGNTVFAGSVTGGAGTFTGTLTLGTTSGSNINMLRTSANYINATNSAGYLVFRTGGTDTALTLDASQNATFAGAVDVNGNLAVEDEIHLTDGGSTVRGKLLLNSSDRDNVELRAESLGSTMKFFTVGTEALLLDASQNATFADKVGVGTAPTTQLQVRGAITTLGDARYNLRLDDATTMAAGVGAGIVFGGQYITGNTTPTNFAAVWSKKENATSGEYGGELHLGTRIDNGNISSDLIINSSGNATFAGTVNSGAITSTGQITGTELEGTSLDINGNADISGNLTGVDTLTATTFSGDLNGTINSSTTATTQSASNNSTKVATTAYVDAQVATVVDSAPGTLNTLNELAAALGDDASFSTTVTNSIATKLPLAGGTMTGDLGLGISPVSNLHVYENSSGTGTGSGITVENDGTGDAIVQYLLTGAKRWVTGIDNSDSDNFKISSSADLGTDTEFILDSSGNGTFAGYVSATQFRPTNIVTNKVVKFDGTKLDDANITDTGSLITLGSNTVVSGELEATSLDINGAANISGTLSGNFVVRSTNNANVDGANFAVDTTNKTTAEYAYEVLRSGTTVGGIRLDGKVEGTELEGTSLDINGNADISGNLTGVDNLTMSGNLTTGNGSIECGDLDVSGTITGDGSSVDSLNAGNIATGTLAVARGGTGLTSISTLLNSNVTSVSGNAGSVTNGVYTNTTQTISGAKTFSANTVFSGAISQSNTTQSTNKSSGAYKTNGGVGIAKTLNVGEDVVAYASSDKRYKDNLQAITNPIDKVKSLTGYTFTWNDKHEQFNGNDDIGVVAQEVEKVFPEIVDTRDNGYKAVKYEKMVALLIEAVKDQQKQIDELKEKCSGCSK